jgi:hypothetical protein
VARDVASAVLFLKVRESVISRQDHRDHDAELQQSRLQAELDKPTCHFVKANGERCKRSTSAGESLCWQHARGLTHRWKSLTKNQTVLFLLALLGIPTLCIALYDWYVGPPRDVAAKLKMTMFFPTSRDIFKSGVVITNGGGTGIEARRVQCYMRKVLLVRSFPSGLKASRAIENLPEQVVMPEKVSLGPDGDEETAYCMEGWGLDGDPTCADVTVVFYYALETRPATEHFKRARFVGRNEGSDFVWRGQPVDYPADFCPNPPNAKRETGDPRTFDR